MGRSVFETILGAVVLAVAALFLGFAYTSSDLHVVKGYTVAANFPMVDGLKEGIDVKINGVKVGSVAEMNLITEPGPAQYLVKVRFTVDPNVRLPSDTVAMVASESLLGGKYLSLEPGVDEDMIKADGTGVLTRTQAPMRLDDLIGQVIYGSKKSEAQHTSDPAAAPAPVPAASSSAPQAPEPPAAPAPQAIPATHP